MKPSTIAIHIGNEPEKETGAVITPIYQTSNFEHTGRSGGAYEYTRAGNPNFSHLEETLAALEGGKYATVYSSGLGAMTALLSLLNPGDHIIASEDLYGGTVRLLTQLFERYKISVTFVPAFDTQKWIEAINNKTKLIIIESPTNPLLQIAGIEKITAEAKKRNIVSLVDNTFATPIFQKPLSLGATLTLHSTTKYIGGHSDVIGGAIITNDAELKTKLDFSRKAFGLNTSPFDAWLTSRGLKTLALRMERHASNAMELAKKLQTHPIISEVIYPGLETHPQHILAKKQMSGFGGMISIRVNASNENSERGFSKLKYFIRAESLGGVESLISHPASQTHAALTSEQRKQRGIGDDLWRLSIGIEDISDLISDITNAVDTIASLETKGGK